MTAKPAHTPGPWTVRLDDEDETSVMGIWAGRERIVETDSGYYPPKLEDARLIAAAPAMYNFVASQAANGDTDAMKIMEGINGNA